ncbi:hypothetical protein BJX61DRAFT_195553 [Aspergillus egyptiacus]|nr:hypothetical protein BJX61DRAFT_195553 [Aspergillus egyptiacus]
MVEGRRQTRSCPCLRLPSISYRRPSRIDLRPFHQSGIIDSIFLVVNHGGKIPYDSRSQVLFVVFVVGGLLVQSDTLSRT